MPRLKLYVGARGMGIRLRQLRQDAQLTQVQLAQRLHWQQSAIARMESGDRQLRVMELVTVAEALSFEPVELFKIVLRECDDARRAAR